MQSEVEINAVRLMREGASDELVERETGLPLDRILALRAEAAARQPGSG